MFMHLHLNTSRSKYQSIEYKKYLFSIWRSNIDSYTSKGSHPPKHNPKPTTMRGGMLLKAPTTTRVDFKSCPFHHVGTQILETNIPEH